MVSAAEAAIDYQEASVGANGLFACNGFDRCVSIDDMTRARQKAELTHDGITCRDFARKGKVRIHGLFP